MTLAPTVCSSDRCYRPGHLNPNVPNHMITLTPRGRHASIRTIKERVRTRHVVHSTPSVFTAFVRYRAGVATRVSEDRERIDWRARSNALRHIRVQIRTVQKQRSV